MQCNWFKSIHLFNICIKLWLIFTSNQTNGFQRHTICDNRVIKHYRTGTIQKKVKIELKLISLLNYCSNKATSEFMRK